MCIKNVLLTNLRTTQNGHYFPADIFKCIFHDWKYVMYILIKVSLKFVPKGPINDIPALGQILAWRHPDSKPSSEPMVVSLLMHKCITQLQ